MQQNLTAAWQDEPGLLTPWKLRQRRNLKIEDITDPFGRRGRGKTRAGIRLKGHWLVKAGFRPADRVAVVVLEPGVLQLRAIPETEPRAEFNPEPLGQTGFVLQGTPLGELSAQPNSRRA